MIFCQALGFIGSRVPPAFHGCILLVSLGVSFSDSCDPLTQWLWTWPFCRLKLTLDVATFWIALSLMRGILHPPGNYWVYMNRTVSVCTSQRNFAALMITHQVLFAASVILLAEKVLLQFVAIRFHRRALAVCNHGCHFGNQSHAQSRTVSARISSH